MKKLSIIGECMIELNGEPFGEMRQSYGGDTLNTATYLARVSPPEKIEVGYISVLGTDPLSREMQKRWREEGIRTDGVLSDNARYPGLYLIQLDSRGERTFLYWRNQSAARYLLRHPDYAKACEYLSDSDMIYLSGISLAILPDQDRYLLINQLEKLAKQGVKIAFDSNYRPGLWESEQKTREIYTALYPLLSLALVTFDDEQALWRDKEVSTTMQRLNAAGVKEIVVKQGKCGAFFHDFSGQQGHITTEPVSNPVDTTSAGDAFNAGFLNGYLQNKSLSQCCRQGNRLAAEVIRHKGAIIDKRATQHFLAEFNCANQ
ncbi:2-keto-3-deoxygluconate kinase [Mesocricetibacter intestinalis]|uniref:2-dehydro-3-deoxygluconokinase n=1 Tax=Mesocricetibacter intestinalis TaxID=1521930 RepID=A0A4R6V932_9PAST|nr:sugar kinase [Mesocricetibacter intestinalis]TDQ58088.1 2-keto-3-deoxygluconate kinase [Mesocricetibacter intestinalis]